MIDNVLLSGGGNLGGVLGAGMASPGPCTRKNQGDLATEGMRVLGPRGATSTGSR